MLIFCRGERLELGADPLDHTRVVASLALPEQAGGRVPGAVVTIEQPAIIRRIGQQDPGWPAERGGKMGDAGIHRDDKIEAADQGSRLDKAGEVEGQVEDGARSKGRLVVRPRVLLQADE